MKHLLSLATLLSLSIIFFSCEKNESPVLDLEDDIYIAADKAEFDEMKPILLNVFEKEIFTPQQEKLYRVKRIDIQDIEKYQNRKNLIVAGILNNNSTCGKFIDAILNDNEVNKLKSGSSPFIKKENLWSENQLVVFLGASSMEQLKKTLEDNKDLILAEYQKITEKMLSAGIYDHRYEKKDIQGHLLKNYNFMLYVQNDFKILKENKDEDYVLLGSLNKDLSKIIFIHWMNNKSPNCLTSDSVKAIRNSLVNRINKVIGDSLKMTISVDSYSWDEVDFKGRYAIFMQGLWDYNDKDKGGPFLNYTFYDEKSKRIYMLDGALYAPGFYKKNLIKQMDMVLQSFMTGEEVNKDRRAELLKASK